MGQLILSLRIQFLKDKIYLWFFLRWPVNLIRKVNLLESALNWFQECTLIVLLFSNCFCQSENVFRFNLLARLRSGSARLPSCQDSRNLYPASRQCSLLLMIVWSLGLWKLYICIICFILGKFLVQRKEEEVVNSRLVLSFFPSFLSSPLPPSFLPFLFPFLKKDSWPKVRHISSILASWLEDFRARWSVI